MTNRLLPLLALFAALAIFFGYVNPAWTGSVAQTEAAIAKDNQALSAATEYTARQNALASARNAIDPADLARLSAFLPDSVDNVGLILDLDALAARSGLALSKVDVSAAAVSQSQKGPTGSIDLSLSAIGSYPGLKNFLRGVEASQRLLDVRDLTVRGSDTGVYTYQMTLRLYWLH